MQSLTAQETNLRAGDTATPLEDVELLPARDLAVDLVNNLSESSVSQHELFPELLQLFVAHILFVPHLGLKERAQPPVVLPAALSDHLHTAFLPRVFLDLEDAASAVTMDGRVFATLLDYVLRAEQLSLSSMLGPEISTAVEEIWSECNIRAPDFAALRAHFPPASVAPAQDEPEDRPLRLLPFEHPLFDEELASIALDVEVDSGDEDEDPSHLEFNTVFSDTQHWHNHKRAILPPHMGGSDSHVQLTEWQRKRQLKSEQRFMAKLQWQAETLTGAYGTPLQQMVIPSAAVARKSKGAPASSAKAVRRSVCSTSVLGNIEL